MKQSERETMSFTFLNGDLFQVDALAQTLRALRILSLNAFKELENHAVSFVLSPVQKQNPLAQNG